ncbi:rhodanese-like domain-containing protein [Agromyces seonyuensis]|uniref:Rhodanese-like domain-containing protein n=1 Tax=Agromyces seonyuensis TaxID=2662446 RepID=A0A6I4NZT0_9MICO|nr:rhodanese-like domain-containing protein [Agromyces seonyuensis]MWB99826.1 rhodanese-like domain-containing protein [Agromyces seonyuensis]
MSETLQPAPAPASTVFSVVPTAAESAAHFAPRVEFDVDVSDVHAALDAGETGFVVVDSRSRAAWDQGHVPGAIHLPTREIAARAADELPAGTPVVVYCWSPGCNGGIRAALELALAGHPVKEVRGGFEYWVREGFEYETGDGQRHRFEPDPRVNVHPDGLTGAACFGPAPEAALGEPIACAC